MKKILFLSLALTLSVGLWAETQSVSYRYPVYKTDGVATSGIKEWQTDEVTATVVESATERVTWNAGWYVVKGAEITLSKGAACTGDVRLILADGAKLTANGEPYKAGIGVSGEGKSLTIYAQTTQSGQLIANGGWYGAGIGGDNYHSGENITINGGVIKAEGVNGGAGIGGTFGEGHHITINGGFVTAIGSGYFSWDHSNSSGAGIGGSLGEGHHITINGGTVKTVGAAQSAGIGGSKAKGHDITINGGTVEATGGSQASGIGGGLFSGAYNITISGGAVIASGSSGGAGIGGGDQAISDTEDIHDIRITGGVVVANTTEGASAIGRGCRSDEYESQPASKIYVSNSLTLEVNGEKKNHSSTTDVSSICDYKKTIKIYASSYPTVTYGSDITVDPNFSSGTNVQGGTKITFTAKNSENECLRAFFFSDPEYKNAIVGDITYLTYTTYVGEKPISVYVKYEEKNETVTYGENITVNPNFSSGDVVACGTSITFTAKTPAADYDFLGFFSDPECTKAIDGEGVNLSKYTYTTTMGVRPLSVYVKYKFARVAVTYGEHITVSPSFTSGSLVNIGTQVTFTAENIEGSDFRGFFSDPECTSQIANIGNTYTVTVGEKPISVYASYGGNFAVDYIDANGEQRTCPNAEELTNSSFREDLKTGWYVVRGSDVQLSSGFFCDGEVHLILADGAKLTADGRSSSPIVDPGIPAYLPQSVGIEVWGEASLTIYGQTEQTGQLIAIGGSQQSGYSTNYYAGIGSTGFEGGKVTINGGKVTASANGLLSVHGDGINVSNVFVNTNCIVKADGNNPPQTVIGNNGGNLAESLKGKQYVTVETPAKGNLTAKDFVINNNTVTYNGEAKAATVAFTEGITGAGTITVTYKQNGAEVTPINVGKYDIYVAVTVGTGYNAFAATKIGELTINKATLTAANFIYSAPGDLIYNGNVKSAIVSFNIQEGKLSGCGEVTVKYQKDNTVVSPINAGDYTVSIDVAEGTNYNAATALTKDDWKFTIAKATLTKDDFVVSNNSVTYDGEAKAATVAFKDDITGAGTITVTYKQNDAVVTPTNVGTYDIYVAVSEGTSYNALAATKVGTLTITKADLTASDFTYLAPDNLDWDGNEKTATVTFNDQGKLTGCGEITIKYQKDAVETSPIAAGDYTVSIDVAEGTNYNAATSLTSDDWKFTIAKATLTKDDFVVSSNSATYDGEAKAATVAFKDDITGAGQITITYKQNSEVVASPMNAGTYDIYVSVTESANYKAFESTKLGTLTIAKADLTASDFTYLASEDLIWDGNEKEASVTFNSQNDKLTGCGDITIKYNGNAMAPSAAGDYTVSIDVAEGTNYNAATSLTKDDWKFTIELPIGEWITLRTEVTANDWNTICMERTITDVDGATFWNVVSETEKEFILEQEFAPFAAGVGYIIRYTATELKVKYGDQVATEPVTATTDHPIQGNFAEITCDEHGTNDLVGNYVVYGNQLCKVTGWVTMADHRAYVVADLAPKQAPAPTGAPRMTMPKPNSTPTGLGQSAITNHKSAMKVIENGQFRIVRDNKMYNAQGIEL